MAGRSNRFVGVLGKGIVLVPPAARSGGPWLDATRATSLQRVANRPILCNVLDALARAGVLEVMVLTPTDLAEDIARCVEGEGPTGLTVSYLSVDADGDSTIVLDALVKFADGAPTIVHRADGLLGQPLAPFIELGAEGHDMVLLVAQGARNTEPLQPTVQHVLRVAELDPSTMALGMVGVCILGPATLGRLEDTSMSSRGFGLASVAESLISREDSQIQVRVVREWRAFAGDPLDLLDMNRATLDALEGDPHTTQAGGNRFEGRVFIDPTATISSSVICGPVIVGAGAYIADSYIGPHTSIGERVHVEGAEIERSIVLAGASIMHVGGRLVASVVGREARIFRDFSMPRAMRLQVGDGDEVALC